MQRSDNDNLISLDSELERTLRRIRKENKEATESEHRLMENLQGFVNEEDVESRSEENSHSSTPWHNHQEL